MEEKKPMKIRLSTTISMIIILVLIGVLVYFVNKNNALIMEQKQIENKMKTVQQNTEKTNNNTVGTQTNTTKEEVTKTKEKNKFDVYKNNYKKSFSNTVSGKNLISIYLGEGRKNNELPGIVEVYVDSSNKAYVRMENDSKKQVESNVANVYICQIGNAPYSDIVFVKMDGTASKISGEDVDKGKVKSKAIPDAKNVVSVISYDVSAPNDSGFRTYAFIDIDGNIICKQ